MSNKEIIVEPSMIQDKSYYWDDCYLGCPNCGRLIAFHMITNPMKEKPEKCSTCGAIFNWSGFTE